MSGRQPGTADDLALILATALIILAAQKLYRLPEVTIAKNAITLPEFAGSAVATSSVPPRDGTNSPQSQRTRWQDILGRTYERTVRNRLLAIAGGVVFFGLLAVFPAVTALVSSYGLFADPATIGDNLQSLALMLPEGTFQIIQDQISRVLAKGHTTLGATFLFGIALALWSANAGVKAVIDALNVAYEEEEKRGIVCLNLLSLTFTVGGIAAVLLMVSAVIALPLVLGHLGLGDRGEVWVSLARWPLLFTLLVVALSVLYRFGPSRRAPHREWRGVGTIAASLLWIVGSLLLSWYLSNFGNYSATYGSLGAAIGLMMWMWMSAIIVLFGAELNSEIERQRALKVHSDYEPGKLVEP